MRKIKWQLWKERFDDRREKGEEGVGMEWGMEGEL